MTTNETKHTPLPRLYGEFDDLSGADQERCRKVLRWLLDEGALDAAIALTNAPHVVVVHRTGWVSGASGALLREVKEFYTGPTA